jgi:hypothetical protein
MFGSEAQPLSTQAASARQRDPGTVSMAELLSGSASAPDVGKKTRFPEVSPRRPRRAHALPGNLFPNTALLRDA